MAGTTLGTAYVQIVPSAQGIKGSISSVLGGEAQSAGASIGGKIGAFAKKAIVAAGIGTVLVKGLKASIAEGAKLQQSYLGGVDTLYGEAADSVREHARAASEYGLSMNDYSEQAVSFGAALKNAYGGDVVKAAEAADTAIRDMADNSAKMGTDINSVQMAYAGFAKQNYTMLDNLKLGYGGTKSEMERLLADAEKLSGVHYDIDNLGDVYDAIHVIQGDLGLTGVAAEEASETFSGSFEAMKAAAANFLGSLTLGEGVSEAMGKLMQSAATFFFGNFLPMVGRLAMSIPPAVGAFIAQGLPILISNLSTMITNLANWITTTANSLTSDKVAAWVSAGIPKMISAGTKLILQFANTLIKNIPKIAAAVARIGTTLVTGLGSAIWGKITAAANGIKNRFIEPINAMKDKVSSIIETIKGWFPINIGRILSNISLPHFSLNWSSKDFGPLGSIRYPTGFNVSWYAKGGIIPAPMTFGAIGMGEAGPEAILPLDPFWARMERMEESMRSGEVTINVYATPGMDVKALAKEVRNELINVENRRRLAWQ